ncbi:MAG: PilZ domain-containing protein [Methylococcaceae bacterium]
MKSKTQCLNKQQLSKDSQQLLIPREARRVYLYQYLDIIDAHNHELLGYLSDFSSEGLMFISPRPFAQNIIRAIIIKNNFTDEQVAIYAQIETLWLKYNINPKMYCVGCRFHFIDTANRQLLEKIGQTLSFADTIEISRESSSPAYYVI